MVVVVGWQLKKRPTNISQRWNWLGGYKFGRYEWSINKDHPTESEDLLWKIVQCDRKAQGKCDRQIFPDIQIRTPIINLS